MNLHLCVLTNHEPSEDVHLNNNNYCFRCLHHASAKNLDRCIRQFDDLLLKFRHFFFITQCKEEKNGRMNNE